MPISQDEGGYSHDKERNLIAKEDFDLSYFKEGDSGFYVESYFIKYPEYDSNGEISRVAEEAGLDYNEWEVVDFNHDYIL